MFTGPRSCAGTQTDYLGLFLFFSRKGVSFEGATKGESRKQMDTKKGDETRNQTYYLYLFLLFYLFISRKGGKFEGATDGGRKGGRREGNRWERNKTEIPAD